jgi:hypothetical protein
MHREVRSRLVGSTGAPQAARVCRLVPGASAAWIAARVPPSECPIKVRRASQTQWLPICGERGDDAIRTLNGPNSERREKFTLHMAKHINRAELRVLQSGFEAWLSVHYFVKAAFFIGFCITFTTAPLREWTVDLGQLLTRINHIVARSKYQGLSAKRGRPA